MDTTVYQPIPGTAASPGTPAVRARSLTKLYGKGEATVRALDGVDVDFEKGAFTAIMGPSGSGKSTLMHLLAGLDTASSGQGFIGDTEITALGDNELTRLRRDRVGFVFQSFNLLPMFTAEQNITLPIELAGRKVDTETKEWLATLVQTLGLGARLTHRPSELSGGQQQRVAIARALIAKPEVVFADEPTGNLDSRSGAEVLSFLRRSVRELGRTIIMVTHDPTAAAYADRVILIADGRIAGDIDDPTPESVLAGLDALRTLESDPADGLAGATGPTAVRA
ncbi:ABC transporter ATP-binding protein [Oerskovia turbata]|uniref:ABC transporter ATP-binding protein n=1 Tax=Oerskovia turbata TaxID=1713 RepID=A0A4Q1KYR6_9CELL|nr:ABC transporter ATP-binding protein [Oerskovia turbata]RXR26751.1 ABC transporter ATP-binding protein [Oerskovia turbata]RXR34484.1 ABC transporter ATP-binding protein [Oerskovia turbata]TGJ97761.1 ABC transporter ATP-binding protein [Actinotalea fermentans ATCC 43279 = JCM 9966 = DSM 3133]